jgi:hypothetical protein
MRSAVMPYRKLGIMLTGLLTLAAMFSHTLLFLGEGYKCIPMNFATNQGRKRIYRHGRGFVQDFFA